MTTRARIAVAVGLLALTAISLPLFGTHVAGCLGPIGVTEVQCIRASGITPSVGLVAPVEAALVIGALVILFRRRRGNVRLGAVGAAAGAAIAAAAVVVFHATSMTGPTSTGEIITVPLPLDVDAVLAAAIVGAGAGLLVGSRVHRSARVPAG